MLVGLLEEDRTGANKMRELGVSENLLARPIYTRRVSTLSYVRPWAHGRAVDYRPEDARR